MATRWPTVGRRLAPLPTLPLTAITAAQEAAMHHSPRAPAATQLIDTQRTAADTTTVASQPRHRRRAATAALIAIAALAPSASALAQPARDPDPAANEHTARIARHHRPRPTPWAITFTNPLDRSRGPGAGAGRL